MLLFFFIYHLNSSLDLALGIRSVKNIFLFQSTCILYFFRQHFYLFSYFLESNRENMGIWSWSALVDPTNIITKIPKKTIVQLKMRKAQLIEIEHMRTDATSTFFLCKLMIFLIRALVLFFPAFVHFILDLYVLFDLFSVYIHTHMLPCKQSLWIERVTTTSDESKTR